jgi:hypothetical protein
MFRTVVTRCCESPRPPQPPRRSSPALFWGVVVVGALTFVPSGAALADEPTPVVSAQPSEFAPPEGRTDVPDRVTEIRVSPLEASPGGTVHVTGTCTLWGFAATHVSLLFVSAEPSANSTSVSVPIDRDTGVIDADIVVPMETHPGPGRVSWLCAADDMAFGADMEPIPFMVLGDPTIHPPTTPLPGPTEEGGTVDPTALASSSDTAETLADTGASDSTPAALAVAALTTTGAAAVGLAAVSRRRMARSRP